MNCSRNHSSVYWSVNFWQVSLESHWLPSSTNKADAHSLSSLAPGFLKHRFKELLLFSLSFLWHSWTPVINAFTVLQVLLKLSCPSFWCYHNSGSSRGTTISAPRMTHSLTLFLLALAHKHTLLKNCPFKVYMALMQGTNREISPQYHSWSSILLLIARLVELLDDISDGGSWWLPREILQLFWDWDAKHKAKEEDKQKTSMER